VVLSSTSFLHFMVVPDMEPKLAEIFASHGGLHRGGGWSDQTVVSKLEIQAVSESHEAGVCRKKRKSSFPFVCKPFLLLW
jgi:hypothetical protein